MIVKTKSDAQKLIDYMKKNDITLEYLTKGYYQHKIHYSKILENFHYSMTAGNIASKGIELDCLMLHRVFIDRKEINKIIKDW